MARTLLTTVIVFMILTFPACRTPKVWVSSPVYQTLDGQSYDIALEPLQKGADFFNWFRLTVTNKTGRDMEIDWNRTRYIHNGQEAGPFIYAGVVSADVKNGTIPAALIPVGTTFTKEIAPFKLIAFTPFREQTIDTEQRNILAGLIPEGENGILLVIRQDGKVARPRISVTIEARKDE